MMRKIESAIIGLAKLFAILGGGVLFALIILTCISIFGRAFIFAGLAPISGDFELVEAGAAFVVFAFLPWCQIKRGHASVDIFTSFLPKSVNRWIDLITEILMGAAILIITWKLMDGTIAKSKYGETTFILQYPIWRAYALSLCAAIVNSIVAIYIIIKRIAELSASQVSSKSGEFH